MSHMRNLSSLINRPLCLAPAAIRVLASQFGLRLDDGLPASASLTRAMMPGDVSPDDGWRPYRSQGGVAYIPIQGVLDHKAGWMDWCGWGTSYEVIRYQLDMAANDDTVRGIFLDVDSPGGNVSGCFDLARRIRTVSALKPVWAALSDDACSAAYALASAAGYVFIPGTGNAGHVGCWRLHVDISRALDENGITATLVASGAHKVDGNPYEPLPGDVRADWQNDMDAIRAEFAGLVAAHRGLSVDAVLATEARTYMGRAAVDIGFADGVADRHTVFQTLIEELGRA